MCVGGDSHKEGEIGNGEGRGIFCGYKLDELDETGLPPVESYKCPQVTPVQT